MSEEMDDRRFQHADRGEENLSQHYRASATEEPSAALDGSILAAAKAQAKANAANQAAPSVVRKRPQWQVPFSIAATMLLSVGLLLTLEREVPSSMPLEEVMIEQEAKSVPAERMREGQIESTDAVLKDDADHVADQPMRRELRQATKPSAAKQAEPVMPAPAPSMMFKKELRAVESESLGGRDDASERATFAGVSVGEATAEWSEAEWLAEIKRLREAGMEAEATALEQAYRQRYPESVMREADETPTK